MASTIRVASLRQHNKPRNANKPRLSPKQCREVTDHWKSCIGDDHTDTLIRQYISPARVPSTKGTAYILHNEVPRHVQREYSLGSTHTSPGGRRNPGRGDGRTWNGDSFICPGQIDSDNSNVDPFVDSCVMNVGDCDEHDYYERPRTIEISLADVPMKVCKPKERKVRGSKVLRSSDPRASSIPPPELGEPFFHQDFETMSNFSWDAMTSDNLSDFSEEDWEDLESAYTHDTVDYEIDRDLKLLRIARNDSDSSASPSPSTTPPRRTYAQALVDRR